jgi:hypothetical protein
MWSAIFQAANTTKSQLKSNTTGSVRVNKCLTQEEEIGLE